MFSHIENYGFHRTHTPTCASIGKRIDRHENIPKITTKSKENFLVWKMKKNTLFNFWIFCNKSWKWSWILWLSLASMNNVKIVHLAASGRHFFVLYYFSLPRSSIFIRPVFLFQFWVYSSFFLLLIFAFRVYACFNAIILCPMSAPSGQKKCCIHIVLSYSCRCDRIWEKDNGNNEFQNNILLFLLPHFLLWFVFSLHFFRLAFLFQTFSSKNFCRCLSYFFSRNALYFE